MSVCIHPECQKTPLGMVGMCVYTILLIKKHTNPPPWPINFSVLFHGLESQLDYPHGLHVPQPLSLPKHISQASGMAYRNSIQPGFRLLTPQAAL